jgi:regulator of nucleoside diphosphate kinase
MTNLAPSSASARPPVHLSELEFDALSSLASALSHSQPAVSDLLFAELDRAQVHVTGSIPPGTVTMNSVVRFLDTRTGAERTVQIVFPHKADISRDRVSVGTPVGAALIGLRAGDRIDCRFHDGHQRLLEVLEVSVPGTE